jgi:hypothetical protein
LIWKPVKVQFAVTIDLLEEAINGVVKEADVVEKEQASAPRTRAGDLAKCEIDCNRLATKAKDS